MYNRTKKHSLRVHQATNCNIASAMLHLNQQELLQIPKQLFSPDWNVGRFEELSDGVELR